MLTTDSDRWTTNVGQLVVPINGPAGIGKCFPVGCHDQLQCHRLSF